MNLWMDLLGNMLTTRQIRTSWEFTIEAYLCGWFGFIENLDLSPDLKWQSRTVANTTPSLMVDTLRLITVAPTWPQASGRRSEKYRWHSQVRPVATEGHCISPVHSGIRPPSDSGPITLSPSLRLPVTKICCADNVNARLAEVQPEIWEQILEAYFKEP